MIPVYVISLWDCAERRKSISKKLNDLSIEFNFFDGVDGRNGLAPEFEEQIDKGALFHRRHLTDTEFACALSHLNVYRKIVEQNHPYALVLEDDAIPVPELITYLNGEYYKDADLTQLHYSRTYVQRKGRKDLFGDYKSFERITTVKALAATGYVISNSAAQHFLDNALPIRSPADWPVCIDQLNCRLVYPQLVTSQDYPSIIGFRKSTRRQISLLGVKIKPTPLPLLWYRVTLKKIP